MESTNHYFRPLGLIILFLPLPCMGIGTDCFRDGDGQRCIGRTDYRSQCSRSWHYQWYSYRFDGNFKLNVSAKGSLKISFYRISDTNDSCSREKAV